MFEYFGTHFYGRDLQQRIRRLIRAFMEKMRLYRAIKEMEKKKPSDQKDNVTTTTIADMVPMVWTGNERNMSRLQ